MACTMVDLKVASLADSTVDLSVACLDYWRAAERVGATAEKLGYSLVDVLVGMLVARRVD